MIPLRSSVCAVTIIHLSGDLVNSWGGLETVFIKKGSNHLFLLVLRGPLHMCTVILLFSFFCIVQCPLEYNSTPQINHTFAITRSLPSISHLNMSTVQTDLQRKMPWSDGVHVSEPDHLEPFFFPEQIGLPWPTLQVCSASSYALQGFIQWIHCHPAIHPPAYPKSLPPCHARVPCTVEQAPSSPELDGRQRATEE
jgi:hypothetical protein